MIGRKFKGSRAVLAVAIAFLCTAKAVRADLIVTVQEDSGSTQTFSAAGSPSSPGGVFGGTFQASTPDYTITFLGGQEIQAAPNSELLSSVTSIQETGSGTHTLYITVTGTGFSSPVTPPPVAIASHIGGTLNVGSETTPVTFQSIVPGASLPLQTPTVTGGSYNSNASGLTSNLSAPFSIEETINVTLTNTGDVFNFSSSTDLTPTPAPAGIVLALSGLPFLAIGTWVRRRKAKTAG
jgi:hypothetical protein